MPIKKGASPRGGGPSGGRRKRGETPIPPEQPKISEEDPPKTDPNTEEEGESMEIDEETPIMPKSRIPATRSGKNTPKPPPKSPKVKEEKLKEPVVETNTEEEGGEEDSSEEEDDPPTTKTKKRAVAKVANKFSHFAAAKGAFGFSILSPLQNERYPLLRKKGISPTRFLCAVTCKTLGILEEIKILSKNVLMWEFMCLRAPTYVELTMEFASSLDFDSKNETISFCLKSERFNLELQEVRNIFSLPAGSEEKIPAGFKKLEFWEEITGTSYVSSGSSRTSAVYNPIFRYIQRVLAHTLFARGEGNTLVREPELWLLWAMVTPTEDGSARILPDLCTLMVKHWVQIINSNSGEIVFGGMVTLIARSLGVPLSGLTTAIGSIKIDLAALQKMQLIRKEGEDKWSHFYTLKPHDPLVFPNPTRVTTSIKENWLPFFSTPGAGPSTTGTQDVDVTELVLAVQRIDQHVQKLEEAQLKMMKMVHAIYEWHISEGHFPEP